MLVLKQGGQGLSPVNITGLFFTAKRLGRPTFRLCLQQTPPAPIPEHPDQRGVGSGGASTLIEAVSCWVGPHKQQTKKGEMKIEARHNGGR